MKRERLFPTPNGMKTLHQIADETGLVYGTLSQRLRKNPCITYEQLVNTSKMQKLSREPRNERVPERFTDYSWNDIVEWYSTMRDSSNWKTVLADMLRIPKSEMKPIIKRLEAIK